MGLCERLLKDELWEEGICANVGAVKRQARAQFRAVGRKRKCGPAFRHCAPGLLCKVAKQVSIDVSSYPHSPLNAHRRRIRSRSTRSEGFRHYFAILSARESLRQRYRAFRLSRHRSQHSSESSSLYSLVDAMEDLASPISQIPDGLNVASKRKRSPSAERTTYSVPPAKTAKMHNSHLQINYLTRLYTDILPLIAVDDALPSLLQTIGEYIGVLDRHESMVGNLGVRLLAPILIKRFERLFEGPPKVLKSHGKEGTNVTWLDVIEFARHKPEQFNLEKMRDGVRVCQFYTKQCRVEISEEDYVLIASGMPQKLIPPQPIAEDEEKELGTLEILEKNIAQLIQVTDQGKKLSSSVLRRLIPYTHFPTVAGRARQLNHRLKNRKNAIIGRREAEVFPPESGDPRASPTAGSASEQVFASNGEQRRSDSPTPGFVAVNARPPASSGGFGFDALKTQNVVSGNDKPSHGATVSHATRAELLNYFSNARERANEEYDAPKGQSNVSRFHSGSKPKSRPANDIADYANILLNSASPVAIPNTPSALQYKAPVVEKFDDSGPYKAEMLSRMDSMQRGDRVLPPCDRCRRLHMDCLKNLTACLGCTKKHAKCSWKDVSKQELLDNPVPRPRDFPTDASNGTDAYPTPAVHVDLSETPQGVPDEELLGEESDDGRDLLNSGFIDDEPRSEPTSLITDHDPLQPSKAIDAPAPQAIMVVGSAEKTRRILATATIETAGQRDSNVIDYPQSADEHAEERFALNEYRADDHDSHQSLKHYPTSAYNLDDQVVDQIKDSSTDRTHGVTKTDQYLPSEHKTAAPHSRDSVGLIFENQQNGT